MLKLMHDQAHINGNWIKAKDQKTFSVINPSTKKTLGTVADLGLNETKDAIKAAAEAFVIWKNLSIKLAENHALARG